MVFSYKRTTQRGLGWDEEKMSSALRAIENKEISLRQASRMFNIPFTTLQRHSKSGKTKQKLGRFKQVFTVGEEMEFVNHIKDLDARFYGLTKRGLCELAYQYGEKNNITHPFRNGSAGGQWYRNFMQRHPNLRLRTPEPTSIARARGFNKIQVSRFFDNLKAVQEKHNFSIDNIYNVDETGIQTSSKRPPKVLSLLGKKQVGSISSSERGTLITALFCCSATGKFIPPALVFPRKKKNSRYLQGTPPGTLQLVTDSGWITAETFLEWLKFFVASVRPSEEQKCLLILDNHTSHRSLDVLEYASSNYVVILSVPPHTTHKLQPLDISVYGPFGAYFQSAIDKWQKSHPGLHVTFYDIGSIFCEAYLKAATPNNAIKGFEKTGISSCNIDVFDEADFLPSMVTDNSINEDVTTITNIDINLPGTSSDYSINRPEKRTPPPESTENIRLSQEYNPKPDSPKEMASLGTSKTQILQPTKKIKIIDIHVLPKCDRSSSQCKRKCQKSEILTSTPVKEEIKASTNNKVNLKAQNAVKKNIAKSSNPISDKSRAKRKAENDLQRLQMPRPPSPAKTCPDEESVECVLCGDTFGNSRSGENWVQCNFCGRWAHVLCSDYKSGIYICDCCKTSVLNKRK